MDTLHPINGHPVKQNRLWIPLQPQWHKCEAHTTVSDSPSSAAALQTLLWFSLWVPITEMEKK